MSKILKVYKPKQKTFDWGNLKFQFQFHGKHILRKENDELYPHRDVKAHQIKLGDFMEIFSIEYFSLSLRKILKPK